MALNPLTDLASLWVADVPFAATIIDYEDEAGEPVELDGYTAAEAFLVHPDQATETVLTATIVADTVSVGWSAESPFDVPGVWQLVTRLVHAGGKLSADPVAFPVQKRDGWLTLDQARKQWTDAPGDDLELYTQLQAAKVACIAYAPRLVEIIDDAPVPLPVPDTYRQAQLLQARAIWTMTQTNPQQEIGMDGMSIRVYPLDKNIRQLLRPKRAIPVVR